MTKNTTDYDGILQNYVEGCAADIIHDECPPSFRGRPFKVEHISSDTDDGVAFGQYDIVIDGGIVSMLVNVSGYYSFEADCWDWSTESHYTRTGYYEDGELDNLEMQVVRILFAGDREIDKMIDADIDAQREGTHDS